MNGQDSVSGSRPFSLGLYLLVVFGLSWPFQIAAAFLASDLLLRLTLTCVSMLMVTVGTLICGKFVFRDGFAVAGWRRGKPKHYLAVIGLVLLLWFIPSLIAISLGRALPSSLTSEQSVWLVAMWMMLVPAGFGEEFGWRGYMLPHLACRFATRRAILWHAIIWWIWHLPILVGTAVQGSPSTATAIGTILLGAIPAILHGVIFAYIWSSSQSLAVATVYHALFDGVRDSLLMLIGFGAFTVLWANLVLIILGMLLLQKGNWRNLEIASASYGRAV